MTLVVPSGAPGWLINIYSSFAWRQRLADHGVRIIAYHSFGRFADGSTVLVDVSTGTRRETREFDSIVAPTHGAPNDALATDLRAALAERDNPCEVTAIGDAQSPRTALEAIYEGHQAGWRL